MKALTLHQPWSWAIAHAGKRVENRTWAPPASVIGQRIAIHAGKKLDADSLGYLEIDLMGHPVEVPDAALFVRGAVESVATIKGYVRDTVAAVVIHGDLSDVEADGAMDPPWWIGPIGWVLTDVIALTKPVPCRGAQGLWTLQDDVEAAVLAQLGGGHV